MIAELKNIISAFNINPGFRFFDGENLYASNYSAVNNTRGTVYIGSEFVDRELFRTDNGGIALAGTLAHECGHIYQFDHNFLDRLCHSTHKLVELHADYLAGFYMSWSSRSESDVEVFADLVEELGDDQTRNPLHHGTRSERRATMLSGFNADHSDIETAAYSGADYVEAL